MTDFSRLAKQLVEESIEEEDTVLEDSVSKLQVYAKDSQGTFPMKGEYFYGVPDPISILMGYLELCDATEFAPKRTKIDVVPDHYSDGPEVQMPITFESRKHLAKFIKKVMPKGKIVR